MDIFLNWVWQGSLVALAAQGSLRLLDRSRGAHRYTLCAAALMTVLALPVLPLVAAGVAGAGLPQAASGDSGTVRSPALALPDVWWTSDVLLVGLWVLWMTAHAVRLALSFRALRVVRRRCLPLPDDVVSRLRWWRDVSQQGRAAHLVISPDVSSAAMLGGAVPAIAIAPVLVDRLADEDLDRVVIHEWAHVQRRDDVLTLMHLAVRALAGWHPAIWWLERQGRIEREAACDEIVISIVGRPKAYAACLAGVASVTTARLRSLPAPGMLQTSNLRTRVRRVLAQPRLTRASRSRSGMAAAALLLALIAWVVAGFPAVAVTSAGDLARLDRASAEVADLREPATPRSRDSVSGVVLSHARAPARRDQQPRRRASDAVRFVFDSTQAGVQPVPSQPAAAEPSRRLSAGIVAAAPEAPRGVMPPRVAASGERPDAPEGSGPSQAGGGGGPWQKLVYTGASVGRGSARAGTATAGAFSRFGRRIENVF
jgi:beta-lactamase regulating signal transducer with metallopeptidase domain